MEHYKSLSDNNRNIELFCIITSIMDFLDPKKTLEKRDHLLFWIF